MGMATFDDAERILAIQTLQLLDLCAKKSHFWDVSHNITFKKNAVQFKLHEFF